MSADISKESYQNRLKLGGRCGMPDGYRTRDRNKLTDFNIWISMLRSFRTDAFRKGMHSFPLSLGLIKFVSVKSSLKKNGKIGWMSTQKHMTPKGINS